MKGIAGSFMPIALIMVGFLLVITVPFSTVFTQYGTFDINAGDMVCLDGYDQGEHVLISNFCSSVLTSQYSVLKFGGGREFDTGDSRTKILSINGVSISQPVALPPEEPTQVVSSAVILNQSVVEPVANVSSEILASIANSSPVRLKPVPISPMIGVLMIFAGGGWLIIRKK